jgi:glycosyltransferase involved in cell wall biosynthesis
MGTPRIAIVGSRGIPARYGGFETFAEEIAVRLVARGYDVTVMCEEEGDMRLPSYRGVRLEYVPAPALGGLTTVVHDCRALWRCRKDFDVVYMLGYGAALFCALPRLWGTPVWINMDGMEWRRSKYGFFGRTWLRTMERAAVGIATRLVADASAIRTELASRYRRMPPATVIPYGAHVVAAPPPPSVLDEWGLAPRRYYIVVCRFEPSNHVLELLEGFADSASPHPLVVLGNYRCETPYIRELVRVAGTDERIRMVGTVYDQAKLHALRYHSIAYLHGHSVGGTNPSLLEAIGCGNPIIAHDNPFNREVAADAGLYFISPADVARHIHTLEHEPGLRERLSARAYARIAERYTWDHIEAAYLDLLHEEGLAIPEEQEAWVARAIGDQGSSSEAIHGIAVSSRQAA